MAGSEVGWDQVDISELVPTTRVLGVLGEARVVLCRKQISDLEFGVPLSGAQSAPVVHVDPGPRRMLFRRPDVSIFADTDL